MPYEPTLEDAAVLKPTARQAEQGLVWMFPGLIGQPWELGPAYRGLRDAGLDRAVRFFEWDRPLPDFMSHLTDREANAAQAQQVADEIVAYRRQYQEQPVDLVGYSAGGFIALRVVESLPEDVHVRHLILAQPNISPDYDLTAALRRIDGQFVNFHAASDWLLCGVFTALVGTMDGRHVFGAGQWGFDLERAVPDAGLRAKVVQARWNSEWAAAGHQGDHTSILEYEWNRVILAPYLLDGADR